MSDVPVRGPRFDPTINLGHLLTLTGVVFVIVSAGVVADFRLAALEREVAKLSDLVVQAARSEERMTDLARRVDRLEVTLHRP
jgi:hypothetical protein